MQKTIFMTGVTGQVGAFVAKELMERDFFLMLLVRGENPEDRVKSIFQKIGTTLTNYQVISGDLNSVKEIQLPRKVDHFLHLAAELSFSEKDKEKVWQANVEGTKNVLHLVAKEHKKDSVSSFHYMSTAYVAGKYRQIYCEQTLDQGQEFNNAYEASKVETEKLCHRFAQESSISTTIYRPGIVMGDQNGTSLRYSGYYVFIKMLCKIHEQKRKRKQIPLDSTWQFPLRIEGNKNEKKHLLPVDYIAQTLAESLVRPADSIRTIYLLPERVPTNQETIEWVMKALNMEGLELIPMGEMTSFAHNMEKLFARSIQIYRPYLESEPKFEQSASLRLIRQWGIDIPEVNAEYFLKIVEYGNKDKWGKAPAVVDCAPKKSHPYFEEFLPRFLNQEMLPGINRVNSFFAIRLQNQKENSWFLRIEKGVLLSLEKKEGTDTSIDFSYELPEETFESIISGNLDPRHAFFAGKTEISGDVESGLKIANVLRKFFSRYPYEVAVHG